MPPAENGVIVRLATDKDAAGRNKIGSTPFLYASASRCGGFEYTTSRPACGQETIPSPGPGSSMRRAVRRRWLPTSVPGPSRAPPRPSRAVLVDPCRSRGLGSRGRSGPDCWWGPGSRRGEEGTKEPGGVGWLGRLGGFAPMSRSVLAGGILGAELPFSLDITKQSNSTKITPVKLDVSARRALLYTIQSRSLCPGWVRSPG